MQMQMLKLDKMLIRVRQRVQILNKHTLDIDLLARRILGWELSQHPVEGLIRVRGIERRTHEPAVVRCACDVSWRINGVIDVVLNLYIMLDRRLL